MIRYFLFNLIIGPWFKYLKTNVVLNKLSISTSGLFKFPFGIDLVFKYYFNFRIELKL